MKVLTAQAQHEENMKEEIFADFFNTRPEGVQLLIKQYPWKYYVMKKDAPYGINPEGTKVELVSWTEAGNVSVGILAINLLKEGKDHIKSLCGQYDKNYKEAVSNNHRVYINPMWMEPITPEEYFGLSLS